jgi:acetolactate synthase regulatory subunit
MPTITTSTSSVQVAADRRDHARERRMRHRRFELETNGRADVLVRVLALLRRRGCHIAAVEFHEADRHRPERFEVAVNAPARIEPRLECWLVGLVDVIAVRDRSERAVVE